MRWPWVRRSWAQRELAKLAAHLCDHQWEVTGGSFQRHTAGFSATGFVSERLVKELVTGVTIVTQRCSRCGDIKIVRHPGRVQIPGYEWKQKTDGVMH